MVRCMRSRIASSTVASEYGLLGLRKMHHLSAQIGITAELDLGPEPLELTEEVPERQDCLNWPKMISADP